MDYKIKNKISFMWIASICKTNLAMTGKMHCHYERLKGSEVIQIWNSAFSDNKGFAEGVPLGNPLLSVWIATPHFIRLAMTNDKKQRTKF